MIKRSKYVFLDYLKGDIFAWLANNSNYVQEAKKSPLLRKASPWRWNQYGLKNGRAKLNDLPTQMVDGLDAGKWVRNFYNENNPNLKIFDFENVFDYFKNYGKKDDVIYKTRDLLLNHDNFIIYEGAINFGKWVIRPDVIIKKNNKVQFIEVKAITCPIVYHAIDVMFQREIAKRLGYDVENWTFKITTVNKNYHIKDNWKNELKFLFREWNSFFQTKPSDPDKALIEGKDISLNHFFGDNEYLLYFEQFDKTISKMESIQLLDKPPLNDELKYSYNKYMKSDYLPWVLLQMGMEKNSIFELAGDSGFNFDTKVDLWNNNSRELKDLRTSFNQVVPKKLINSDFEKIEITYENFINKNDFRKYVLKNHQQLKRVLQIIYFDQKQNNVFIDKTKINNHLKQYNTDVIYMYDFETISQAIPRVNKVRPYQQAPYQYSIHVITDPSDFDFATKKNIVHYEWIANDPNNFYDEFWKNFTRDITAHGDGAWVSYNKSFEKMVMNDFIKNQEVILNEDKNLTNIINKIYKKTIDLMEPFQNRDYYSSEFLGSYSIKKVGPHFVPEIKYTDLDGRVQKGDQSAFQAKLWLILEEQEKWEQIKIPMLKYCELDTLMMVGIFQRLKQKIGVDENE